MSDDTSKKTPAPKKARPKHAFTLASGDEAYTSFAFKTDDEGDVIPKTCPKSDVVATCYDDITELFGWRKTSPYADGTPRYIPQSWSAAARNAEARKRRAAAKSQPEAGA